MFVFTLTGRLACTTLRSIPLYIDVWICKFPINPSDSRTIPLTKWNDCVDFLWKFGRVYSSGSINRTKWSDSSTAFSLFSSFGALEGPEKDTWGRSYDNHFPPPRLLADPYVRRNDIWMSARPLCLSTCPWNRRTECLMRRWTAHVWLKRRFEIFRWKCALICGDGEIGNYITEVRYYGRVKVNVTSVSVIAFSVVGT